MKIILCLWSQSLGQVERNNYLQNHLLNCGQKLAKGWTEFLLTVLFRIRCSPYQDKWNVWPTTSTYSIMRRPQIIADLSNRSFLKSLQAPQQTPEPSVLHCLRHPWLGTWCASTTYPTRLRNLSGRNCILWSKGHQGSGTAVWIHQSHVKDQPGEGDEWRVMQTSYCPLKV